MAILLYIKYRLFNLRVNRLGAKEEKTTITWVIISVLGSLYVTEVIWEPSGTCQGCRFRKCSASASWAGTDGVTVSLIPHWDTEG